MKNEEFDSIVAKDLKESPWVTKLSLFILRNPRKLIFLSLLSFFALIPGLKSFHEEFDVRGWFRDSDSKIKELNQFEQRFGNDERLVIVFHSPTGIFEKKTLKDLRELTNDTWNIPEIARVDSLTNFNDTIATEDDLVVDSFIAEGLELTPEVIAAKKERASTHPVLSNYFISESSTTALIIARLVNTPDSSPNYESILKGAKKLKSKYLTKGDYTIHLIGEAGANDAFREVAYDDNKIIVPLLFLLIAVYLAIIFRNVSGVVLPLAISMICIVGTLGLCFYLGFAFDSLTSVLPGIIIAISIADSVHIMTTYFQSRAKGSDSYKSCYFSLKKNLTPTILTSISTMIGFSSLIFTELKPVRHLGVLSTFGCGYAWFISVGLIIPACLLLSPKPSALFIRSHSSNNWSLKFVAWIRRFSNPIIFGTIILASTGIILMSLIKVNSNPFEYFKKNTAISKASDFVRKHFNGSGGPQITIDSGSADGIKDPTFLIKVEKLIAWIESLPKVNKVTSVLDVVKLTNQALNRGDSDHYKIPGSNKLVAETLFLYSLGLPQGMEITDQVTLDHRFLRMSILWNIIDTKEYLDAVKQVEAKATEFGLNAEVTGKFYLYQSMMGYIVTTFFSSMAIAMTLVSILMMIIFRSFKLGLLSLIPNVLPLSFGGGVMYLSGMSLDVGTALVASVCLGIAVDDTIHFLSNYYRLKKSGLDEESNMVEILHTTGVSLMITTIILASSFGLFMIGDFIPNVDFGILCAVILTCALGLDIVFLPALLIKISEIKKKYGKRNYAR